MKKYLALTGLVLNMLLFQFQLKAQVNVSIQILPPYPTRITDYSSNPQLMVIMVTNTSTVQQRIQLRGAVTGDNGIELRAKPTYKSSSPIVLGAGESRSMNGNDLAYFFDYTSLTYKGITQNEFINKNGLPEGSYRFCLRAYNYDTNQPISSDEPLGCSNTFTISSLEPPVILSPMDGENISSANSQIFNIRWNTPVSSPPGIRYHIRMVEILGNRNPNDAIMTATQPYFFDKEVMGNSYVYNPADPQLTPGRSYALMVEAEDPFNHTPFRNKGRSEVVSFTYTAPQVVRQPDAPASQPAQLPVIGTIASVPDCSDCKVPAGTGASKNDQVTQGAEITVNRFKMTITSVSTGGNGLLNGTGTIGLPFVGSNLPGARLRVQFSDLDVNASMVMKSGNIQGVVSGNAASLIPQAENPLARALDMNDQQAHSLQDFFNGNGADHLLSSVRNSASTAGFELPLGLDGGLYTIAIARIYFNAEQAWFEAATVMDLPDGNSAVALSGRNMCLNAENLCKTGELYLSKDFNIDAINLVLKKPGNDINTEPGTSITFTSAGFDELTIDAEYQFPDNSLVDAQSGIALKARFKATGQKDWNNWVAEVQLPEFYVSGMQSIKFNLSSNKMYYDHSDFQNPAGMPTSFTSSDPGETPINTGAKTWRGFFIPQLSVTLPEIIKNLGPGGSNGKIAVNGVNFLFDNTGFTGMVSAANILQLGNGSMGGWYASIDAVNLDFFKSAFKSSSMRGKLVLPASGDYNAAKNQLDYNATLTTAQGAAGDLAYNFSVTNKSGIEFNALFMTVDLDNNSEIVVEGGTSESLKATAVLNGKLSISNTSNIKVPGVGKVSLPGVKFQNLKLMTYGDYIDKSGFSVSFASPSKSVAGFDFNLETAGFDVSPANGGVSAGLKFKGNISLAGEAFSCKASAAFTISSGIKKQNDRITWAGVGGKLDDVSFAGGADLGAFHIKGAIKYFNRTQGQSVDEGFIGALETGIAGMLTVNMRARFGTKSDAQGDFKYFDFNALADLGQTGITFAPPVPLALYGFGGGFYYNMNLDESSVPSAAAVPVKTKTQDVSNVPATASSDKDPDPNASAEALLDFNPAGLKLSPQRGSFGLQATILFGLTSRNTLDADATFSMGFTSSGGVQFVRLNGNARILTNINKPLQERRGVSTGAGSLLIDYDFPNKTFDAQLNTELGVPSVDSHSLLHVTGNVAFHSSPDGWYIHIGRPDGYGEGPNTLTLLSFLESKSYFEVGSTEIDPMPEIPADVLEMAGGQKGNLNKPAAASRTYNVQGSNKGLVLGASQRFGFENAHFLMFTGSLYAKMGFDLAVNPDVTCDGIPGAGGPGGWYARGQAYMGAKAKIGITVNLLIAKGTFNIFDAGAGAIIKAGLPNPSWAEGNVGAYFSILDGAISGNFHFGFSVGDKCVSGTDAFGGLQIISELTPLAQSDEKVPLTTIPGMSFNIKPGGFIDGSYHSGYFRFEDYEHTDERGNPTQRAFLFDKSCLNITLNGVDVTDKLKRIDDYSFSCESNDYLAKNTNYKFVVKARLKERILTPEDIVSGNWYNGTTYEFVRQNGTIAEETKDISFNTDGGFALIPSSEYVQTVPLHSHKSIPTEEYGAGSDRRMFVEFKKVIDPQTFMNYPEGTQYVIRVFRNGQREGADMPLAMDIASNLLYDGTYRPATDDSGNLIHYDNSHSRWSFAGVNLQKSSLYTMLIIAKAPQGQSAATAFNTTTTNLSATMGNVSVSAGTLLLRTTTIGRLNKLSAGEQIAGGFSFHTSSYATFSDKFAGLTISKIANLEKPAEFISLSRSIAQNKAQFLQWWPMKNGKYTVQLGMGCTVPLEITLGGERLSKADLKAVSSDEIFLPDYFDGQTRRNIHVSGPFKESAHEREYTPYADNDYAMLKAYLSARTGIPVSQINVVFTSAGQPVDNGLIYAYLVGGTSTRFTDNLSSVGQKLPDELPQSAVPSATSGMMTAAVQLPSGTGSLLMTAGSPVIIAEETAQMLQYGSRGQPTFSDPIQRVIDKVVNWNVNPNPSMNVSNIGIWQSIGGLTNSYMNGTLSKPQLPGAIQGAFH